MQPGFGSVHRKVRFKCGYQVTCWRLTGRNVPMPCKSLWEELNLLLPIRTTLEVAVRRTSMSRIGRGPVAALDMHRAQAGFPIPTSRVEDLDEQAGYAL
jgi:hypothetical protein